MPSPLKDRPSGRIGRLLAALRPSRAGPLPVQTGFPTSLADLVVKNHGRLKKQTSPSSKRRKGGISVHTSPSPSLSPSPPPSSQPQPPPAATVSPSDPPRLDLPPAPASDTRRRKGGGFGLGLGFLAVSGVVSLALLVIWSKKVVAAVTVASLSLFLLESVRSRSLPRRRPPAPAEGQVYLDGRGRVSPIREVEEAEPARPSCSDSDMGSEFTISAVEENSDAVGESGDPKAKAKKRPWKKLIAGAKKLHRGRKGKEVGSSGSFRGGGGGDEVVAAVRGNVEAPDPSGSRRHTASPADAVAEEPDSALSLGSEIDARPVEMDAPLEFVEVEGRAGIRFPALVVVALVLVGLVAGKLPALAFTVLCSAFLGSVQRVP